jgi:stage II sporulation protein D
MKYLVIFLTVSLSTLCAQQATTPPPETTAAGSQPSIDAPTNSEKTIRVLLHEHNLDETVNLDIHSDNGFVLESPTGSKISAFLGKDKLMLLIKDKKIYLKCPDEKYRKVKNSNIEISNPHNRLKLNGRSYEGKLTIHIDEKSNAVLIINTVDLEDYIYSVLRSECIPYWPLEMQKIQAITSRSYAQYLISCKKPSSPLYDILNTNFNQLYNGHHGFKHLRQAVQETKNIILTYKGKPALAMFDISCGGIIPGFMKFKDTAKPYLCRTNKCTFCRKNSSFLWKEDLHENSFMNALKNNPNVDRLLKDFGKLVNVKVVAADKAGIAHNVRLFGSRKNITLTAKTIKTALKGRIKSLAFSIKKQNDRIVIIGHGFGHCLGLCQCGARELVSRGWNFRKILNFYFPQTELKRLV